ncbi:MAG: arginine deiminase family protein [Candidatus Bathyarchaeota archaeon]|nr:arginine deiminase family protein [Candidatus Bathyarchaeota archaeon]
MDFGAQTEYGRLRKVLMHRPSEELKRITPGNKDAYLFRDVVYWKEFQREHDAFTDILRGEGIEVCLLGDFLDEEHRQIAERLPNLVYTRDAIAINNLGAMILRMTYQSRFPEPFLTEKAMEKLGVPVALKVTPPGLVEGGDFVWLDEETVMMGYGTRSNEVGVEQVKERMMGETVKEFVAVPLPSFRVHLDGALMVMSPDLALFHKGSLGLFPSYVYDGDGVKLQFLEDYLKGKAWNSSTPTTARSGCSAPTSWGSEGASASLMSGTRGSWPSSRNGASTSSGSPVASSASEGEAPTA